jgi:uncharacterized protein YecT (DUF1311 family)
VSGPSRSLRLRLSLSTVILLFGSPALSQTFEHINGRPRACDRYDSLPVPAADLPTAQDRQSLKSYDSYDLYFGFIHPADPVKARKCAYLEREKGNSDSNIVFGASGLLVMIYANGEGAERNFDLALKFECEVDGARAENDYRFEHLQELKNKHWTGSDFNLCDDATSGFMQGWCAKLQEDFDRVARTRKLNKIIAAWSPDEKREFRELNRVAKVFFDSSRRNEVDLSGTGRAAFEIEAEASLSDGFVAAVERFERGELPSFSQAEFKKADAELNSVYSGIQSKGPDPDRMGTVTPEGIRIAERAWLGYREAWVKFGQIKYPAVTPDSWRTWLTQERVKMLQDARDLLL